MYIIYQIVAPIIRKEKTFPLKLNFRKGKVKAEKLHIKDPRKQAGLRGVMVAVTGFDSMTLFNHKKVFMEAIFFSRKALRFLLYESIIPFK